ncbi:MAG: ASKHA domain-containing protein [Spirochaetota bacterium]
MGNTGRVSVTLQPYEFTFTAGVGNNLQQAITAAVHTGMAGLPPAATAAPCGGRGTCGKCLIQVLSGSLASPTERELRLLTKQQLQQGVRLACQSTLIDDLVCSLAVRGDSLAAVETRLDRNNDEHMSMQMSPLFRSVTVHADKQNDLFQPDIAGWLQKHYHIAGGSSGLLEAAGQVAAHLEQTTTTEFEVLLFDDQVVGFQTGKPGVYYGAAVDIGTTTLACYLVDLQSHEVVASHSDVNSQSFAGSDVISRIGYALERPEGRDELARCLQTQVDRLLTDLLAQVGGESRQLKAATIVGNTAILQLLLGLPSAPLARYPFIATWRGSRTYPAAAKGDFTGESVSSPAFFAHHPCCSLKMLPGISAYIGADVAAGVVSTGVDQSEEWMLYVDLGTNGEMVLGRRGVLYACATAAGPAFEGACIECGSGGVSGAIDRLWFADDTLQYTTIFHRPPRSLCGSGIIDVAALLHTWKLITPQGKFVPVKELPETIPSDLRQRRRRLGGKEVFFLVEGEFGPVYVSQKDIREIQLAKAAVAVGIEALLERSGASYDDIAAVYTAGGFGNSLNVEHATLLGVFPRELAGKISPVGNAAGHGALLSLLYYEVRKRCEELHTSTTVVDLASRNRFARELVDHIPFPNPIPWQTKEVREGT